MGRAGLLDGIWFGGPTIKMWSSLGGQSKLQQITVMWIKFVE